MFNVIWRAIGIGILLGAASVVMWTLEPETGWLPVEVESEVVAEL